MTTPASMDVISSNGMGGSRASGSVAQRLLTSGFDVSALRTNDLLRKEEWVHFDTAIVETVRANLPAVSDILNRGLRYDLPNALGHTMIEWQRMGDMTGAEITMSGIAPTDRDKLTFDLDSMPVPIIHKDWQINIRLLEASRNSGRPLDTLSVETCTRKVTERIERMYFNGAQVAGVNGQIYGIRTVPHRHTGSLTASWATATGDQIVADILQMQAAAVADNYFGPYIFYISHGAMLHMGDDYKAGSDKTIMQRIREIPGVLDLIPTIDVLDSEVIMLQPTRDVVDMVVGFSPIPVSWDEMGGLIQNFKIMAIMVPRFKVDQTGQSGIVHHSV